MTKRLSVVTEPEATTHEEFTDVSRAEWDEAKDAYHRAHSHVSRLLFHLHKRRYVTVRGDVVAALDQAERLRDEADQMVIALTHIRDAARKVER